ncbi:MAG: hypothetical protein WBM50_20270 [Acidimicrobiales bacterium]
MKSASSTRLFLNLFVASILVNAVLGIWALLSGDFGETQGKVLGTSFLVSAAMLSVLVNIPALRRRALWPAPSVGAAAGASGFALFIVLMWTEAGDDRWFKLAGSFLVVAAGATLASSLALLTKSAPLRWLQAVGNALITLLALTVLFGLWFEPDNDWFGRIIGVEGVLVAALTLLIPVLSRFASPRQEANGDIVAGGPAAVRFCPSCGRPVANAQPRAGAAIVCDGCGLTFEVTMWPVDPDPDVRLPDTSPTAGSAS